MSAHKWAEVIKAWADGKTIQYRGVVIAQAWKDYQEQPNVMPAFHMTDFEWRIKPERWYRVAHMNNANGDWVYTTTLAQHETSAEGHSEFVRWLTERIYY